MTKENTPSEILDRIREKIFFFPDQHLGQNTANQMGIPPGEVIVWDPARPLGGNLPQAVEKARVILWKGYCLVHTRFTIGHMESMRKKNPGARIVVHPECTQEVVHLADAVGSTSYIVNYVESAAPGSRMIIGTEINLVGGWRWNIPIKRLCRCMNPFPRICIKSIPRNCWKPSKNRKITWWSGPRMFKPGR